MSIIDLTKVKAASFLHGFGKKNRVAGSISVGSFTFYSDETRDFEGVVALPVIDAASIVLLRFNGVGNTNVNGRWVHFPGSIFFRNATPSYDVQALVDRRADGLHLRVQFLNPTFASNQTVPNITIDYKVLLFDAPW